MKTKYIPALVMLMAGAIAAIANAVHKVDNLSACKSLLLTLIIFYIIGLIARSIIDKIIQKSTENIKEAEKAEEAEQEQKPNEETVENV